ncbi:WD40 repeat-like protein [Ceraceosorus guamensis]|uniref:WD40 repeat-like protein n=1 Tax=Ceraceosorus guamensis TaxID=1522189 RepID=A0A316VUS3_9BASI|nr:WD40 repeat-like protein [Ceraceosorus guamensis]PWN40021.1 WD40 repeat-like protein [Ceraceosorus guamensis]
MSIFDYTAPWPIYGVTWSNAPSARSRSELYAPRTGMVAGAGAGAIGARVAISSFVEEANNEVQVLGVRNGSDGPYFDALASTPHPYPASKIAWQPSTLSSGDASEAWQDRELLATTADCLRIWECASDQQQQQQQQQDEEAAASSGGGFVGAAHTRLPFSLVEKSVLAHASKNSTSPPAPLTSFSWNAPSPSLVVTSSIDTTCTIWDLPTRTALTQLIAHDREVYDVDWCPGSSDVFASVGADGSVRVFDLRSLEHSTIIYETGAPQSSSASSSSGGGGGGGGGAGGRNGIMPFPLLRIAFNPWDANYLATFAADTNVVSILDVRAPGSPILELRGHAASINSVAWGPPGAGSSSSSSKGMISTTSDDGQVLVYDLASSTLRSASAQGRRSRNGRGGAGGATSSSSEQPSPAHTPSTSYSASPAPSSGEQAAAAAAAQIGGMVENPVLAHSVDACVNNCAWLRPFEKRSSKAVVATPAAAAEDYWMAVVSGRNLRALAV